MERELIETLQKGFAELKALTRDMAKTANALAKLQHEAGRHKAGNAAMNLEGIMVGERSRYIRLHSEQSDLLLEHFPDFAAEVIMRGPPR